MVLPLRRKRGRSAATLRLQILASVVACVVVGVVFIKGTTPAATEKLKVATQVLRVGGEASDAHDAAAINRDLQAKIPRVLHDRDDVGRENPSYETLLNSMTKGKLGRAALKYQDQYQNAFPFPHIVFDDFFPEELLKEIEKDHPESILESGCLPRQPYCLENKVHGQIRKSSLQAEHLMGFHLRMFMSFLKSSTFLKFLEKLTGIEGLIPDPHYYGSGLHVIGPGGYLDIHHDFNSIKEYKLERRVNMFVFLNEDWKEEYGGHLEMWSSDMTACGERVLPSFGRFVVFTSNDFSYHGHPHPLTCPQHRARRSIALYFYTTGGRPEEDCEQTCPWRSGFKENLVGTTFRKPELGCTSCLDDKCNKLAKSNSIAVVNM